MTGSNRATDPSSLQEMLDAPPATQRQLGRIKLNLNQLRVFFFVAKEKSFTRGARLLNITQPAASLRVRELELESGTQLFERIGQRIVLTEAGNALYGYAQRIFGLLAEANHELENLHRLNSGRLRIGAGQTSIDPISSILNRFKRIYPGVTVSVDSGNSQEILAEVLSMQLHAGLVASPPADRRLVVLPCIRDALVLIVSKAHVWAKHTTLPLEAIDGQPFVIREPGSATRTLIENALRDIGAKPRIEMELPMNAAIGSAVAAGIGAAIVPNLVVGRVPDRCGLHAIRLQGTSLVLKIDWIFLANRAESAMLRALRLAITESDTELVSVRR